MLFLEDLASSRPELLYETVALLIVLQILENAFFFRRNDIENIFVQPPLVVFDLVAVVLILLNFGFIGLIVSLWLAGLAAIRKGTRVGTAGIQTEA
jgi:hypothetical protein